MFPHISRLVQSLESACTAVCLICPFRFLLRITDVSFMFVPDRVQWGMYRDDMQGTLRSAIRSSTLTHLCVRSCKKSTGEYKYNQHANRSPIAGALPILGSQIQIASSRDTKVQSLPGQVCKSSTVQYCVCTNNFIPLCKRKDLLKLWALNQCIAMKGNLQLESDLTLSPRIIHSLCFKSVF